jgi:hypothetical protein
MISVGEAYRPEGPISTRSVMTTAILGTVTALLCATVICLWEISPVPTLVILTSLIHGCLIGFAMAYMVGRLRMRNPRLVAVMGLTCGLMSVFFVHVGHYFSLVNTINKEVRNELANDASVTPEQKEQTLEALNANPAIFADQFLKMKLGHGGLLGSMLWRADVGVHLKSIPVTGIGMWLLWAAEAAFVAFMATTLPVARAREPFCEDCGYWCPETTSPLEFSNGATTDLITAIREDDAAKIRDLYSNPPPGTGVPLSISTHCCPSCDLVFASVSTLVASGKDMKKVVLLKEIRISPETGAMLEEIPQTIESEAVAEGEVPDEAPPPVEPTEA